MSEVAVTVSLYLHYMYAAVAGKEGVVNVFQDVEFESETEMDVRKK